MKLDYEPKPIKVKSQKERAKEIKDREQAIKDAENNGLPSIAAALKAELKLLKSQWRTPNTPDFPALKLVAESLGGEIGVDVAADDRCLVPARHHITEEDDFLRPDVNLTGLGPAYMNCDYARPLKFLSRLAHEYDERHCDKAISLCKKGVMSNQGTGPIIEEYVTAACLWGAGKTSPITGKKLRRMAFIDHEDCLVEGSDFDTVFLYFGINPSLFIEVFKPYGSVWIPV